MTLYHSQVFFRTDIIALKGEKQTVAGFEALPIESAAAPSAAAMHGRQGYGPAGRYML
ncbi:MAG: hypothetical protein MI741_03005 [Rhodospirillales bacterium]|nr:hypothetical protein [Rhodospirillales bacterium]